MGLVAARKVDYLNFDLSLYKVIQFALTYS
jgi:hypothetical protein